METASQIIAYRSGVPGKSVGDNLISGQSIHHSGHLHFPALKNIEKRDKETSR